MTLLICWVASYKILILVILLIVKKLDSSLMARTGIFPLIFFVDERFILKGNLANFFFTFSTQHVYLIYCSYMYVYLIYKIYFLTAERSTNGLTQKHSRINNEIRWVDKIIRVHRYFNKISGQFKSKINTIYKYGLK